MSHVRTPTVIVVDDDELSRAVVARKLKSLATVIEAADGVEALSKMSCVKIDLAIIDLEMPRVNGIDLIGCLRGLPALKHIPIIVLTANEGRGGLENALAAGATSFLLKPLNWNAFGSHIRHVLELAHRANHVAMHDPLTHLPNRGYFTERLISAIEETHRGQSTALHLIDLDLFKVVNDTLGHPVGDKLLQQVSSRLQKLSSSVSTVARLGGDEFAALQVGCQNEAEAASFGREVIEAVSQPYLIDGRNLVIGATVGTTLLTTATTSPSDAMQRADLALYRAKRNNRGTHCMFEPTMLEEFSKRINLESELRRALARQEFELHYQPIVDVATSDIVSVEALIRWRHPARGLLSPIEFLDLAEESGEIRGIGAWVVEEACRAAAMIPGSTTVSVNVSAAQFKDNGLVDIVKNALDQSALDPSRLELEITESRLLANASAARVLNELRSMGVRSVIDDFGTGFSSLSYLHSLPFDKIKIDKSFVEGVLVSGGSEKVIRCIIALAREFGIPIVSEGVESIAQRDALTEFGLRQMQGYLFSRPLPLNDLLIFMSRHLVAKSRIKAPQQTAKLPITLAV